MVSGHFCAGCDNSPPTIGLNTTSTLTRDVQGTWISLTLRSHPVPTPLEAKKMLQNGMDQYGQNGVDASKSRLTAGHIGRVGNLGQHSFRDPNIAIEDALQRSKNGQRCEGGRETKANDSGRKSKSAEHQRRFSTYPIRQPTPLQRRQGLGKVE
jgi:hypothetical protein